MGWTPTSVFLGTHLSPQRWLCLQTIAVSFLAGSRYQSPLLQVGDCDPLPGLFLFLTYFSHHSFLCCLPETFWAPRDNCVAHSPLRRAESTVPVASPLSLGQTQVVSPWRSLVHWPCPHRLPAGRPALISIQAGSIC